MGTGGSAAPVAARIAGDVRGQVAVGNNIVQYNVDHGGVVWAADPAGLPRPRLRDRVEVRGRRPRLVGREADLRAVSEALTPDTPVELSGPAGIGKTTLLKHLAHDLPAPTLAVVYHDARGEPAEDVLQFLYDAFYDTGVPFKPTPGQLREALAGIAGLIVLDEIALDRVDVESVLDAAPGATFVLASEEQRLWGQGRSLAVRGLPAAACVALLERELGRAVVGDERTSAEEACRALDGSPLRVVQLAALVRDLGGATADPVASLSGRGAGEGLVERLRSSLGAEQRKVLGILEAAMGASLSARHLAELVGMPDIQAAVEPLLRAGLVQAHSPRYSVREPRHRPWSKGEGPSPVADYLAALGEADRQPDRLAEEAAAILQAVGQAREDGDWTTVLRLGRAAERALALSRRWGAWEVLLRHQLEAARALGDRRAEAWALHQLGTRALCLDDPRTARANLAGALAIRNALDDRAGSAASRHNLEHLDGPPPPPGRDATPRPPDEPSAGPASRRGLMTAIAAAAAVIFVVGMGVLVGRVGDRPAARALRIQGVGYSVMIEPADVDFGDAPVGSATSPRRLTIVNTGPSPFRVGPLAGIDSAAGFVAVNAACAAADLPPAGRCDVEVVFRPTAAGTHKANVAVPLPDRTQYVTFSSRGLDASVPVPGSQSDPVPTTLGPIVAPTTRPTTVATTTTTTIPVEVDLGVVVTYDPCLPRIVAGPCADRLFVTVTNLGTATATDVRLTIVAAGLVISPQCVGAPTCGWPALPGGDAVEVPIVYDVVTTTANPSITAIVESAGRDPRPDNNISSVP